MELKNLIFMPIFFLAFGFLFFNLKKIYSYLQLGQKEARFDSLGERSWNVIKIAFGQSKLLREPAAGLIHFFIFWGFILFLFAVAEALVQGFYTNFTLEYLGPFYWIVTFTQDVFGILVLISVLYAFYRRYLKKVKRLQGGRSEKIDAALVLTLILLVVLTMFGQNASHVAKNEFILSQFEFRFISGKIASYLFSSGSKYAEFWFEFFWWAHIIIIFLFINYLPYSKHFHVYSSIPNVFFGKVGSGKYSLKPINLENDSIEQYGAADIEHLTWKQMLDGYSCTECGRCSAACPATNTGKKLSPKRIIEQIRKRIQDKAPLLLNKTDEHELLNKTLIRDYISEDELWACTTCMACVQECPVSIEHIDSIVEMRRNLTLMESSFPNELNGVFKNLENNFTPWAFNWQDRAAWAEGLNIKTLAEDQNCEILFWVGCAGSFDARYQKVSVAFAKLMQKGGIDFRILGTEEKCNGDTARRLGNEYLAQMMIKENVETLNNYKVKKIVTACPHCYNSLKNEFPQFGGHYKVVHHSELIEMLLKDNKVQLKEKNKINTVTFHDSCYLGRYNDIYDSPRDSLKRISSLNLIEMQRNRDKGFCCGAGGGRMFLEEKEGTRINVNRTEEALNSNADTIASACPFCMTMLTDGVKSFNKSDEVEIKDIAELILENTK